MKRGGSYFISYGFGEGDYQSRGFRAILEKTGYQPAQHQHEANHIIAHSGGCYLVDRSYTGTLILINPPYWPGRSYFDRTVKKIAYDFKRHKRESRIGTWFSKTLWNISYVARDPGYTWRYYKAIQKNPEPFTWQQSRSVIIVRNTKDTWCQPLNNVNLPENVKYVEIEGEHDDCWTHPDAYIKTIAEY